MCRQVGAGCLLCFIYDFAWAEPGTGIGGVAHSSAGKEKGLLDFQEIPGMKRIETVGA